MVIDGFDSLLAAARAQPTQQRLLFVFVTVELPDDSNPQQRTRFEAGEGGALVPVMTVDKMLDELQSFESLVAESQTMGADWRMVFVAGLSGTQFSPPSSQEAERALLHMVESIKLGQHLAYIPFDRDGHPVNFG